jgi:hypothetical protein
VKVEQSKIPPISSDFLAKNNRLCHQISPASLEIFQQVLDIKGVMENVENWYGGCSRVGLDTLTLSGGQTNGNFF